MIRTEQELFKLMMEDLRKVMILKSEEILDRWRDLIMQNWYNKHPESNNYNRTYELLASLTSSGLKQIPNGYEVLLYFDTGLMHIERNGTFIQHIQRDILPDLIEEGYHVFGGKQLEGANAYGELMSELNEKNYFLDEIQNQFGTKVTLTIK